MPKFTAKTEKLYEMKKIINPRIPVIFTLALSAGIYLGYIFALKDISLLWITATVPAAAVFSVFWAVFNKKYATLAVAFISLFIICCGATGSNLTLEEYSKSRIIYGKEYLVTATVSEKGKTENGEYVILNKISLDGEKKNGKIIAYLDEIYGEFCDVGYKVSFIAEVEGKDVFPYGKLNRYAQDNVKYSCFVHGGMKAKYAFSLFGDVRSALRRTLYKNTDGDTAAVAYAMLTGNTQSIEENTINSFRQGGVAHIFAVSGLHIGLVFGIHSFICRIIKSYKYLSAVLCLMPILFYAGVCGFTSSALRALIMCTVSTVAKLLNAKYDGLNALAVAVSVILIISPLNLFSAGLQLSVCAVGGIILLSKNFLKRFSKIPPKIKSAFGVSVSAQAATAPVLLSKFGYLSISGLFLNILVLPVLSAVFVLLFVTVVLATVVTAVAGFIIPYAVLPLQLIISFFINAGFENALISGFGAGAFAPVFLLGIVAFTDKINLKTAVRALIAVCSVTVLCSYTTLRTFMPADGYSVIISADIGGGRAVIKHGRKSVLILSENCYGSSVKTMLHDNYATDLSAVILLGGENCALSYGGFDLDCRNIYAYGGYFNLQPYGKLIINYEKQFYCDGIKYTFGDGYSVIAETENFKVAVCTGEKVTFGEYDLLITDCTDIKCDYGKLAGFNSRYIKNNVYDCGQLVYKF